MDNNKNIPENISSHISEDAPVVVALDIGTTKIAVIVGVKNKHDKIEVLAYANVPSKGVLTGAVANIKDATESIGKAIHEVASKYNVEIGEVVVGVAGQYIKTFNQSTSLTISGDEVSESDIKKMLEDIKQISQKPGEKIISIIPQDFIIDNVHGITQPIGYSGKHIKGNFHVVSVTESIIKNITKCLQANSLSVQEFFLEPIASAAAVLTEEQKESGVCLIDIGGGTTDIAIYHGNIIRYSAVIPFGGDIITQDIKTVCKLTKQQAEKLKIEYGSAIPYEELDGINLKLIKTSENLLDKSDVFKTVNAKFLASVINYRVKEITEFIDKHLESSGYKETLSSGIILTGGGSLLKNIQNAFMAHLGIETSIGIPNQHISTSIQELKSPIYSTAIGLLVLGFQNLSEKETENQYTHNNTYPAKNSDDLDNIKKLNTSRKSKFLSGIISSIKSLFETPDNIDNTNNI
ncbi:MAG: cell division protein FtsA [Bacteroidetes bacterium]|jgi:cell division protein FtsA|nr:MAG: cell division protein FtsA [Bacteroidota bacterium]